MYLTKKIPENVLLKGLQAKKNYSLIYRA